MQDDSQRVGLFARGTAGGPDSQLLLAGLSALLQGFSQHGLLEDLQLRWIAEKTGFIGGDHLKEFVQLLAPIGVETQKIVIFIITFEVQFLDPVGEPVFHKIFAVFGNKDAALQIDEIAQQHEFLVGNLQILAKGRGGSERGNRLPLWPEGRTGLQRRALGFGGLLTEQGRTRGAGRAESGCRRCSVRPGGRLGKGTQRRRRLTLPVRWRLTGGSESGKRARAGLGSGGCTLRGSERRARGCVSGRGRRSESRSGLVLSGAGKRGWLSGLVQRGGPLRSARGGGLSAGLILGGLCLGVRFAVFE